MNPVLAGIAAAACLSAALIGFLQLRQTPEGARALLAPDVGSAPRPSLTGRAVRALSRRYAQPALALMSPRRRTLVSHRLDSAGRPGGLTLEGYAGRKAAYAVLGGGGGLLLLPLTGNPLLILLFALLGWMMVDFSLAATAKRRQARIDRDLPDFLDVLAVTVAAGLGFRSALGRVSQALGGPLGEEVRTALRQMDLGADRRAAFLGLRERNDSESLSQFMTALLQAEELGAPLSDTLGAIAVDMRKAFSQRARRQAARAAPRVSLIITTIVVPGAIILILAALIVGSGVSFDAFGA